MSNIEKLILESIVDNLEEHGFPADLETDMIFIAYGHAHVSFQDNDIGLSFSVSFDPTEAAIITKLVMEACVGYKSHSVEIYEPFLEVFDEDYNYVDTLWGEQIDDYNDSVENMINQN